MLIEEQWGIENAPFWHYWMLVLRSILSTCKIFVSPDSKEHGLNYRKYIVSDRNEHLKFDSDRKLSRWLEIWTKFLDMVTKL